MVRIEQVSQVNDDLVQAIINLFPQLTQYSPLPDQKSIQEIVNSQPTSLWVAINDREKIVGMLSLAIYRTPTGVHAWIEDVVVDQNARRQGVASALTTSACTYAHEKGAKSVSLTSRPVREAANILYQKLGFERVETNLYRLELK
jgi:ribosomal protein S18 acetylase RimI-like enzyme